MFIHLKWGMFALALTAATHNGNIKSLLIVCGFRCCCCFCFGASLHHTAALNLNANIFELNTHEFIILTMRMEKNKKKKWTNDRERCGTWWLKQICILTWMFTRTTAYNYCSYNCSFSRFVCIVAASLLLTAAFHSIVVLGLHSQRDGQREVRGISTSIAVQRIHGKHGGSNGTNNKCGNEYTFAIREWEMI